jgi:hypothetical protein
LVGKPAPRKMDTAPPGHAAGVSGGRGGG